MRMLRWMLVPALLLAIPGLDEARAQPPSAAVSGVRDPVAFVRARFAQYERGEAPTSFPDHVFSARLQALFDALSNVEGGEERIDFDWWVDGQDFQIDQVRLKPAWLGRNRFNVHARWRNFGSDQNGTFLFVREGGRWHLDDVVSHTTGWTLSILLEQAARR
jgi:hypothetical protein